MDFVKKVESAESFDQVYRLVKQLVMEKYGLRRAGMGLILADLPPDILAYHEIGSNAIVVNTHLLNAVSALTRSREAVNSYIFIVLLHEYLHALGFDEKTTRELVKEAVLSVFPFDHLAAKLATSSLYDVFPEIKNMFYTSVNSKPVIVRDFDTDDLNYIL